MRVIKVEYKFPSATAKINCEVVIMIVSLQGMYVKRVEFIVERATPKVYRKNDKMQINNTSRDDCVILLRVCARENTIWVTLQSL